MTCTQGRLKDSKSGKVYCSSSCAASFNNTQKRKSRRSKCEKMLFDMLINHFKNISITPNDKNMLSGLEVDIAIPSLKLAIEWNGIVHFKPIYGYEKLNKIKTLDAKKIQLANEKGINLIVIPDLVSSKAYVSEAFHAIRNIIENLNSEKMI